MDKYSDSYGGSDSFKASLASQMRLAAAQARQINPDAADALLPTFTLAYDLWPPHFRQGISVEFDPCPLETVESGDYLVVRHGPGLMICRFVDWSYDGTNVSMLALVPPKIRAVETLLGKAYMGIVTGVGRGDKKVNPNKRKYLENLYIYMTRCGTISIFRRSWELLREAQLVMSTRNARRAKSQSLLAALREVGEWHRKCMEEEARLAKSPQKEVQELKSSSFSGSGQGLARQLGYRDPQ